MNITPTAPTPSSHTIENHDGSPTGGGVMSATVVASAPSPALVEGRNFAYMSGRPWSEIRVCEGEDPCRLRGVAKYGEKVPAFPGVYVARFSVYACEHGPYYVADLAANSVVAVFDMDEAQRAIRAMEVATL